MCTASLRVLYFADDAGFVIALRALGTMPFFCGVVGRAFVTQQHGSYFIPTVLGPGGLYLLLKIKYLLRKSQ